MVLLVCVVLGGGGGGEREVGDIFIQGAMSILDSNVCFIKIRCKHISNKLQTTLFITNFH